jgi:hypothetical protein
LNFLRYRLWVVVAVIESTSGAPSSSHHGMGDLMWDLELKGLVDRVQPFDNGIIAREVSALASAITAQISEAEGPAQNAIKVCKLLAEASDRFPGRFEYMLARADGTAEQQPGSGELSDSDASSKCGGSLTQLPPAQAGGALSPPPRDSQQCSTSFYLDPPGSPKRQKLGAGSHQRGL